MICRLCKTSSAESWYGVSVTTGERIQSNYCRACYERKVCTRHRKELRETFEKIDSDDNRLTGNVAFLSYCEVF